MLQYTPYPFFPLSVLEVESSGMPERWVCLYFLVRLHDRLPPPVAADFVFLPSSFLLLFPFSASSVFRVFQNQERPGSTPALLLLVNWIFSPYPRIAFSTLFSFSRLGWSGLPSSVQRAFVGYQIFRNLAFCRVSTGSPTSFLRTLLYTSVGFSGVASWFWTFFFSDAAFS